MNERFDTKVKLLRGGPHGHAADRGAPHLGLVPGVANVEPVVVFVGVGRVMEVSGRAGVLGRYARTRRHRGHRRAGRQVAVDVGLPAGSVAAVVGRGAGPAPGLGGVAAGDAAGGRVGPGRPFTTRGKGSG